MDFGHAIEESEGLNGTMVLEVMRSGRLSIGPMQERFEELVVLVTDL